MRKIKKLLVGILSLTILSGTLFVDYRNVSANSGQYLIQKNEDGTITGYYISKKNERIQNTSIEKLFENKERLKTQSDVYLLLGKGDVDRNGKIELLDAKLALKGALGIIQLTDEERQQCDLLSTGEEIDLSDVHLLLQAALGIDIEEPLQADSVQ